MRIIDTNGCQKTSTYSYSDTPIGSIIAWTSSSLPYGYLECDGSAVSRATYAQLFAVISTTFGVGDGSTTFNIPDLRGRILAGAGTGTGGGSSGTGAISGGSALTARSLSAWFGEETHLLTSGESGVPAHTHPNGFDLSGPSTGFAFTSGTGRSVNTGNNSAANASNAHNNLQPTVVVRFLIKYASPVSVYTNPVDVSIVGGRLTGQSGTWVTTSDVTSIGTLYYTPGTSAGNGNNQIALFNGSAWQLYSFSQVSLSLSVTSGKNYDVFIYNNAGVLTLTLSSAWSSDTARTDALGTQDGVVTLGSDSKKRWLGVIRASGTNTIEDSAAKRFIVNAYNRTWKKAESTDSSDRSTTSASPSQIGSVQVSFVTLGDYFVETRASTCSYITGTGTIFGLFSIGDSTTTTASSSDQQITNGAAGYSNPLISCSEGLSAGAYTRYFLFRIYSASGSNAIHADGQPYNNGTTSGGQPGTKLWAMICC